MARRKGSDERMEKVLGTLGEFGRRLRRLEAAVRALRERLDRLSTRRRKEAARERGLRLRLDGLEGRLSRAIASLERKVEECFKELAEAIKMGALEARLEELDRAVSDLQRRVAALEGDAPASREAQPLPSREVRATRRSIGVRALGGKRWIAIPRERFFKVCEVAAKLGSERPFTAKEVYEAMPELHEIKAGMFQVRNALSAMELMGLIKRVGKGENGVRLYSPAVPADRLVGEAVRRVNRLVALREGREALGPGAEAQLPALTASSSDSSAPRIA